MINKTFLIRIILAVFVVAGGAGYTALVYAQSPSVGVDANQQQRIQNLKNRANQEITQRVNSLNKLINRIGLMKKLTASDKQSLISQIQAEITILNQLNTKIQADTDLATLRTDVQSITKAYRIFWLYIPKIMIMASADRINDIADNMTIVAGKLQTRINKAKTSGKDVNALSSELSDAQSKIADARTQAANAANAVTNLVPDNGNNAVLQSNIAALRSARSMIKTAAADLRTAWTDFKNIVQTLKSWGGKSNITPSPVPSQ